LSIERLPAKLQSSALSVCTPGGAKVTLGANCWYAFVCASLSLLKPGGSLAFVLPAAWDYASYAAPLRDVVPSLFRNIEVHRSRSLIFPDVQDGAVVLLAEGYRESPRGFRRVEHATAQDLIARLVHSPHTEPLILSSSDAVGNHGSCRLSEILDIKIGTVTGDANFFLLTEDQRRANQLPLGSVMPVISRAHHLIDTKLTPKKWQKLRDDGERVWLFFPTKRSLSRVSVQRYLRLPVSKGGCDREAYKVKSRNPWYHPDLVGNCDGFISGMSRAGPWICFSEMPGLSASNTLYTVKFRTLMPKHQQTAWALSMLTSTARKSSKQKCRFYADGLEKYEPGDLGELIIPKPPLIENVHRFYKMAVKALLEGDPESATSVADRCFHIC
jgi:hypothetical protein